MLKNFFQKDDPLKKFLLEKYSFNLLSIPRKNASVGDLYTRAGNDKRLSFPSNIVHFFEPGFKLPELTYDEPMADISGTISKDITVDIGLEFLEGFLNVLGTGMIGTKFRTLFKNMKTIRFGFSSSTRDYMDANLLLNEFGMHKLKEGAAIFEEGARYYIVTGVIKSPSISIIATDNSNKIVDIKPEFAGLIDPSVNVSSQSSAEGIVTFKGSQKLVFGVELYELEHSSITNRFRLKMADKPFIVRGEQKTKKVVEHVLIGDIADPFITIV